MRKLVTLFTLLAIAGVTTACGESPVGVEEYNSPVAHSEECDSPWPYPVGHPCYQGEG